MHISDDKWSKSMRFHRYQPEKYTNDVCSLNLSFPLWIWQYLHFESLVYDTFLSQQGVHLFPSSPLHCRSRQNWCFFSKTLIVIN